LTGKLNKIVFVIGPSCSGKTVFSSKLKKLLDADAFSADQVYEHIYSIFGLYSKKADIYNRELNRNPDHFGLTSWGHHPNFLSLLEAVYSRLVKVKRDSVIFEGSSLGYFENRRIVLKLFPADKYYILRLKPEFSVWAQQNYQRNKNDAVFGYDNIYEKINSEYDSADFEKMYTIVDQKDFLSSFDLSTLPANTAQGNI